MKNLKRVLTLTLALTLTLTLLAPAASAAEAKEELEDVTYHFSNEPVTRVLVYWTGGEGDPSIIWVYPDGTTCTWVVPEVITTSDGIIKRYDARTSLIDMCGDYWEEDSTDIVSGTYPLSDSGLTRYSVRYEEEDPNGGLGSISSRYLGGVSAITESYLALLENSSSDNIYSVDRLEGATVTDTGWIVDTWAEESFNKANASGLISSPNIFPVNLRENISRRRFAHIAVTLYELMSGQKAPEITDTWKVSPFTDSLYDAVVVQAYQLGIVNGTNAEGTLFDPDGLVTREQAAVMLARVYEKLGGTIPTTSATTFADDSTVSGYAKSAVAFMADKGIVGGVGDNQFNPQGNCKCEEALVIALRMLETLK